jgi:hypothetical protein
VCRIALGVITYSTVGYACHFNFQLSCRELQLSHEIGGTESGRARIDNPSWRRKSLRVREKADIVAKHFRAAQARPGVKIKVPTQEE